ncbi:MAG: outer membrane lipid asymmetry maintenance protein MlaD [Gammaproteobacteria bacterium]
MVRKSIVEVLVGLFMLAGMAALVILAFKVSGLAGMVGNHYYVVTADFDTIGSLKERAPITIAGVKIGQVGKIELNRNTFRARVNLLINERENDIPTDSSVSILTQGLLGANYLSITPGFSDVTLKKGDQIQNTHPALILENLIGQLLFNMQNGDKGKDKQSSTPSSSED